MPRSCCSDDLNAAFKPFGASCGGASAGAGARDYLAAELAAGGLVEAVPGQPVPDPRAVGVRVGDDVVDVVQAPGGGLVFQPFQDEGTDTVTAAAGGDDERDARVAPFGVEPAVPGDLIAVGHPPPLV